MVDLYSYSTHGRQTVLLCICPRVIYLLVLVNVVICYVVIWYTVQLCNSEFLKKRVRVRVLASAERASRRLSNCAAPAASNLLCSTRFDSTRFVSFRFIVTRWNETCFHEEMHKLKAMETRLTALRGLLDVLCHNWEQSETSLHFSSLQVYRNHSMEKPPVLWVSESMCL